MSMNPPSTATGTEADRLRLTEAQKKANHIASEQKRRQAIRNGFDRLAALVPGMEGQGRSEALVLQASVTEIEKQKAMTEKIKRAITRHHANVSKAEVEGMFKEAMDRATQQANAQESMSGRRASSSTPRSSNGRPRVKQEET